MPGTRTNKFTQTLRLVALRASSAGLSDGQLLDRFVAQSDEAAFEAPVRNPTRLAAKNWRADDATICVGSRTTDRSPSLPAGGKHKECAPMKRWKPEGLTAMGVLLATLACVAACRLACGPLGPVPHASGDAGRSPYENESDRTRAKRAAAEDVIAGRRTLLDAAAAFRDVDAADPERAQEVAASLSAAGSADEGYCRSVIAWVRAEAPPADADALAGRLEAEVDARLRAGTLRLPGSGGPPSANSE